MFKKIASVCLAATMVAGTAAAVSAAETTDDAVAASDSSAVAASDSSAVAADSSSSVGATTEVYFDVKSAGWESTAGTGVFCHIYAYSSDGKTYPSWQSKAEKCTYDSSTGIATYDLQTGIKKGNDGLETIDSSNKWCIMFSTKAGNETCSVLFNSGCYGDTLYCPDPSKVYENNVDSDKTSIVCKFKNSGLGAAKVITSTAKIQGEDFAYGESNETILSAYLHDYGEDTDKVNKDIVQTLFDSLKVSVTDVAAITSAKLEYSLEQETITQDEYDLKIKNITAVLAEIKDPTNGGETVSTKDIQQATDNAKDAVKKGESVSNVAAANNTSGSGSASSAAKPSKTAASTSSAASSTSTASSTGSGSTGSGSTGSGSTGSTGNGTVSSGQDSTIFFVFGGLMLAAAGVMFLARKKREF